MLVYKFGGASVKDAAGVRNVSKIIVQCKEPLVVVVSAMGKTTNALEVIMQEQSMKQALEGLAVLVENHLDIARELNISTPVSKLLSQCLSDGRSLLSSKSDYGYDEFYDQFISLGEQMSSQILTTYLKTQLDKVTWVDARKLIKTDEHFRFAGILWRETEAAIQQMFQEEYATKNLVVTQGFIGATLDGRTTTLGREGSDYTAAIFSYCLDADSMTVWKDVPGVLSADPRILSSATLIPKLSYREAIEMTYYGAQVIHPKTIQPIQRKEIPLWVKSFLNPSGQGTLIDASDAEQYQSMIVFTKNQYFLNITTKDFSFIAERHLSMLFRLFNTHRIRVNLMRNSAISFSVCLSAEPQRLNALLTELEYSFNVEQHADLELITIRHFNDETIDEMKRNRLIIFEEIHDVTFQMVCRSI